MMAKISEEQKHFLVQDSMQLEFFARNVFGNQYYGSAGWTAMSVWKTFYIDCLKLIANSFDQSVGSIDGYHRGHIFETIEKITENIRQAKRKDDIHKWVIIGLFQLVFLLLGNVPKRMASNKRRHPKKFIFSGFRTLSYCQTEEQFGWLLRSHIEKHPREFGFGDFFDAQMAFVNWSKAAKDSKVPHTYVDWVRELFPELYAKMK